MGNFLLTIPEELQLDILAYLVRLSDLKSLCLTCKDLGNLSRPLLYRTIRLSNHDDHFAQVFKSSKLGLQHTRHLILDYRGPRADEGDLTYIPTRNDIENVLLLMPCNGLRRLIIRGQPPPESILDIIIERQKALEHLSLPPTIPGDHEKPQVRLRGDTFPELTSLVLYDDIGVYAQRIIDGTKLKHLAIRRYDGLSMGDIPNQYINLLRRLEHPLTLRQLRLEGQDFGNLSPEEHGRMNFEDLECLHIYQCPRSDVLLEAMSDVFEASKSKIHLETLVIDICAQENIFWQNIRTIRSLQKFLKSFAGLKVLHIRSGVNHDAKYDSFGISCLDRHCSTLQSLYLGFGTNGGGHGHGESDDHWRMSAAEAARLFSSCKQLSSVSLAMPVVSLDDVNSSDSQSSDYDSYRSILDTITRSPLLKYLRILTWPIASPEQHGLSYTEDAIEIEHHASMYLRHVDNFASKLLQHVASTRESRSELAMLCIGDTYDIDRTYLDDLGSPSIEPIRIHQSLCYLTGTQRDYFGRESIVAIPVTPQQLQYVAPEYCGMTEFGQGVSGPGFDCMDSH